MESSRLGSSYRLQKRRASLSRSVTGREACRQNRVWQTQGLPRVRVAVNVSAVQFGEQHLARKVRKVIADASLEPKYLELELTKSAMIPDAESAIDNMSELQQMGVQIAIDNFGTGYSSLSYLRRLPVDTLGIARSYMCEIPSDADSAAIVLSVTKIAHSLGLKVLAEGVETEEQLTSLRAHNCDMIQGFLFSEPQPPDELAQLLREWRSECVKTSPPDRSEDAEALGVVKAKGRLLGNRTNL
jgi:EAL domain-containing protein (putative c-di-GMP-specific phosphodiesterase class I)